MSPHYDYGPQDLDEEELAELAKEELLQQAFQYVMEAMANTLREDEVSYHLAAGGSEELHKRIGERFVELVVEYEFDALTEAGFYARIIDEMGEKRYKLAEPEPPTKEQVEEAVRQYRRLLH